MIFFIAAILIKSNKTRYKYILRNADELLVTWWMYKYYRYAIDKNQPLNLHANVPSRTA